MARDTYQHEEIEKSAQEKWASLKLYETDLAGADPYYLLVEFPYPSGDLHIGHWYAFALTDIYARYMRMQGKTVLFPIGFDAFGLPAENAAIRNNVDPKEWTYQNMERMRAQIKSMGTTFDWSKEVVTCDPSYYRFTQWLFGKLYEHGLAYRAEAPVKWCPKDQTVLANEQVTDGVCERCGTEVEEKRLTQWFMKITDYAPRLLADLKPLPWREEIKEAQRAWIGESEGAKLFFDVPAVNQKIEVFTTRPDTVFGATYVVLAPEHSLIDTMIYHSKNESAVRSYREATKRKTERERSENKEKTGVCLEGVMAINPATKEEIPIYIADYVLASYGTGAVMAVPAHDERDHEFAKKYELPILKVISGGKELYTGDGELTNSGEFSGRNNREAYWDIVDFCKGEKTTNYRIRDWLVSRQRYWGCPIPIVYDTFGKPHRIPDEHLPWELPTDVDFTPTGKAPLASSKELKERVTRIFGEGWTPEYDTLDTFVDSSWYFLRYLAPHDKEKFSDASLMKKWLPVDRYSGGSEHTTMHLLYARFFQKALFDLSLVPTPEPFNERFNRGIILGPDGAKMSKSKGNVVNPDEFVSTYGADAVRMYLAFIGPYNEPGSYPWGLDGVSSMRKFLNRIYALKDKVGETSSSDALKISLNEAILKVAEDTERFKFNTAISALMVLVRDAEKEETLSRNFFQTLLILLAPFAPHLAEHLYGSMGADGSVHQALWPAGDKEALKKTVVEVVVQVNGKRRASISVAANASEKEVLDKAIQLPNVREALGNQAPGKVVYVPGRVLNLVGKP